MARVRPLIESEQVNYEIEVLTDQLIADLRKHRINRKKLLELSGTSNSALSKQLTRGRMTIQVYLVWQKLKMEKEK